MEFLLRLGGEVNEAAEMVLEHKVATTPEAMNQGPAFSWRS
jgi:hypothetical protein